MCDLSKRLKAMKEDLKHDVAEKKEEVKKNK